MHSFAAIALLIAGFATKQCAALPQAMDVMIPTRRTRPSWLFARWLQDLPAVGQAGGLAGGPGLLGSLQFTQARKKMAVRNLPPMDKNWYDNRLQRKTRLERRRRDSENKWEQSLESKAQRIKRLARRQTDETWHADWELSGVSIHILVRFAPALIGLIGGSILASVAVRRRRSAHTSVEVPFLSAST